MRLKNWATLSLQAFGTGALGWLATHATVCPPSNQAQWEALAFGMFIGGAGGLYHLWQPMPGGGDEAAAKLARAQERAR
jgi:hypothetical protein